MDSGSLLAALVIVALACPIGMWLMMRGRSREMSSGHRDSRPESR